MKHFPLSYAAISDKEVGYSNPYAAIRKIPLGTIKPPSYYGGGEIPEEDIVYIKFDAFDTEDIERSAFNILILAASGDGKSKLAKLIWSVLHDANYYCLYIDPKTTNSGNAKIAGPNKFLPPLLKPKGIKLKHYLPMPATKDFNKQVHNFNLFSLDLNDLDERDMWMGLDFTSKGAMRMLKIISELNNKKLSLKHIENYLKLLHHQKDINSQTKSSIEDRLSELEYLRIFERTINKLDLMDDFKQGNSVCISYNSRDKHFMSFDVGEKIRRLVKSHHDENNPRINPVMVFLDDSSYYAKFFKKQDFNLAVSEIQNIGNNYRALGIFNCMMVQTLGIIDEDVAETYPIKIISPLFKNPESLHKINVPKEFIRMLQDSKKHLIQDEDKYLYEWTLVQGGNHVQFFPFMPPCNHFKRVYFPK